MTDVAASATPAPQVPPRKKSSMGKIILKLFLLFIIIVVVGLVILFLNLNTLVRAGVIRGGKYATNQDTGLITADLSLSAGSLQLNGFDISNVEGFKEPKILTMKSCTTTVESSSIFSHTVVVQNINIDGLEVTLEQNGMKNNLNELMTIIQKKTPAAGNTQAASPGKELKIGVIKITGTKVHVRANPMPPMDFSLPDIEMADPTNPDGRPMKIADLIGKILLHLSQQIVENPQIPGNIKEGMKNVTDIVNNVKGLLNKDVKNLLDVTKNIDLKNLDAKSLQNAGKNFQDTAKNLQESTKGLKDAGKGLQDMFGGRKDPPK